MPDHLGDDMRKVKDEKEEKEIKCKYTFVEILNKSKTTVCEMHSNFLFPNF